MTEKETAQLLFTVKANYPKYYKNITEHEFQNIVKVWHMCLIDYDYDMTRAGVIVFMTSDCNGFPPSVGQIIDCIHKINDSAGELNEMEAWALVSKALRNGYYGAEEEFAKLPPVVQKAVGAPSQLRNWAVAEGDSIENVIQSNFMRTYRTVLHREQEVSKIPAEIRSLTASNITMQITEQKPAVIEGQSKEPTEYKPEENPPDQFNKLIEKLARGLRQVL